MSLELKIDQIRALLEEVFVEVQHPIEATGATLLPSEFLDVVRDIVDYLQPLLEPYQAAFYWHLFRHSIANGGAPFVRISTRSLQQGVVRSAHSEKVSQGQIRNLLAGLEAIGAIRKEADPNRLGTLYRVLVPDQIDASLAFKASKVIVPRAEISAAEIDYYNVRENRAYIYDRDNFICYYCQKQLTRFTVTLDHVIPVSAGGDNGFDNLVTCCLPCNSSKVARPVGDFLAERTS